MTFDIRSIGIIHELTAWCHGRLVTGGVKNTDVSSDNADPNNPAPGDPLRGSVLAGDSGKYIAMKQDFDFTIAKGRVPDNPIPQEALGGWHTDYANVNQNQMVGIGKVVHECGHSRTVWRTEVRKIPVRLVASRAKNHAGIRAWRAL